jgi:hypothetical protein
VLRPCLPPGRAPYWRLPPWTMQAYLPLWTATMPRLRRCGHVARAVCEPTIPCFMVPFINVQTLVVVFAAFCCCCLLVVDGSFLVVVFVM